MRERKKKVKEKGRERENEGEEERRLRERGGRGIICRQLDNCLHLLPRASLQMSLVGVVSRPDNVPSFNHKAVERAFGRSFHSADEGL